MLSTYYVSSTHVGDMAMNMSDQVPLPQADYSSSHPPDLSSTLCTLEADLYGLHHLSSLTSGFLIKLRRIQ